MHFSSRIVVLSSHMLQGWPSWPVSRDIVLYELIRLYFFLERSSISWRWRHRNTLSDLRLIHFISIRTRSESLQAIHSETEKSLPRMEYLRLSSRKMSMHGRLSDIYSLTHVDSFTLMRWWQFIRRSSSESAIPMNRRYSRTIASNDPSSSIHSVGNSRSIVISWQDGPQSWCPSLSSDNSFYWSMIELLSFRTEWEICWKDE